MKLLSISLQLVSALVCRAVTASSGDYDAILNKIVNNDDNSPSGGEGQVTLSTLSGFSTLSSLTKRDAEPYFKELDMYSFDNYEKVAKVGAMLKQAQSNEMLGDALYLYNLMDRNGYTHSLALNGSSEFVSETCKFLYTYGLNSTESLASTASSTDLMNYYRDFNISLCDVNHPTKRSSRGCDDHHSTNYTSCDVLNQGISDYGIFPLSPRSFCGGDCCISWSAPVNFNSSWAQDNIQVCMDRCLVPTGSCIIRDAVYNDVHINFCVSNRGRGCH
ncbi:hypothetical protein SJAG_04833 [Schizosaccharomyces japonicus yFS275]|uniref:WD-like domain-containing protein n=1 Tax=Schizosaccharomyces japonicus (strain yFS275 / FY16936) TaxID=402676 RepID=B6K7V9_SCHJY|nr:hypothetical protein SJAG_04833 [Schizosaccharomyces japonicus yFS275]EEB09613.1 hypothetical protein SJAG_04833 [Schizosaccharomyces japonicus yFS275]